VRTEGVWRGLLGAWVVGFGMVALRPDGAPSVNAVGPRAAIRDSLLATEAEYQGWKWFHVYCYRCHGVDAVGGQLAPDLRNSLATQGGITRDTFLVIVRDGRATKGMPPWNVLLNDKQIEELYAYVKARSAGRLAPGRPHRAAAP
jgi:mono/diheme cytochrome c family protein